MPAKYALVVWRDTHEMGCVELSALPEHVARQEVIVIAREFEPAPAGDVEPAQSNPRRYATDDGGD